MNEKALYLVVAAVILMFLGAAIFFMVQNSSGSFTETSDNQQNSAECEFLHSSFDSARFSDNTQKAQDILREAKNKECSWASGASSTDSSDTTT